MNREACESCGNCAAVCPTGALEVIGREMAADEVMSEILKDALFYRQSGGGVTFSGGEPTLQHEFLLTLLAACRNAGIHTALDTCGYNRREIFRSLVPYIDLFLYDLKSLDDELHKRATGVGVDLIIGNLKYLDSTGIPLWLRTPVIPGYTERGENIRQIARFIRDELTNVKRYDLLPFSNLCASKYDELGIEFSLAGAPLMKEEEMKELEAITRGEGLDNVVISGLMSRK